MEFYNFIMSDGRLWAAYVLLVLLSGYFSSAEIALASVNKIRIKGYADEGNRRAKRVLRITENFDRALTAILVGNNIVNVFCAAIATVLFVGIFQKNPSVTDSLASVLATAATTVIVFLFGEMLPKCIAKANAERYALFISGSLAFVMAILRPLTFLFMQISRLLSFILRSKEEPTVTEEELSDIIDTVEEQGVIDEEQSELLQSALEFSGTRMADVLTLRDDIVGVEVHSSPEEILDVIRNNKYSRLPVYDGDLDNVVGVLAVRRFLKAYVGKQSLDIRGLMKEPYYVALEDDINNKLTEMSHNKHYLAIVRDSADKTVGLVTVEDFLEELVGEIFDEDDVVDENFMKLGGNYFAVSGNCTLEEVFAGMGYEAPEPVSLTRTVQAWLPEIIGRVPDPDEEEQFDWNDLTITVTEVEENRIKKAEIKLNTPELTLPDITEAEEETAEEAVSEESASAETAEAEASTAIEGGEGK